MNEHIHSGQFMVSKYDEESEGEDEQDNHLKYTGYNFDSSILRESFHFTDKGQCEHKLEIDESLNTMFQYLSIAMSGKITNPKWNAFKGVEVQLKDKIRLNNIIWREYHMQFVKKLKPVVVQFAPPFSDGLQINGNVVLEGKYWKKKVNIIVHQYKTWREYYKNLIVYEYHKKTPVFDSILVQRNLHQNVYTSRPPPNLNDYFMDLDYFNLPIDDVTGVQHNSQIIQPQLTNLQPRMESSIDFLNDYFCSPHKTIKSQKHFSSETCLNVKPQETNNIKISYFQASSTITPATIGHESKSFPINNRKSRHPYPSYQKPYHTENTTTSTDLLHCKTPNLLSILLQPMSSETTPLQQRTTTGANGVTDASIKQSALITTSNYPNKHRSTEQRNDSSMIVDRFQPDKNLDPHIYKQPQPINYSERLLLNSKYPNSIQKSVSNQPLRTKYSLNANNAVQQCFDELSLLLISNRDQNKISKAALLHKASEHIKRLRNEKYSLQSEITKLQSEIDSLQNRFSAFCSQLPATGVCLTNNKSSEAKKWFEDFVSENSLSNWKFYVFSMIFESLFTGYNNSVSTLSMDTLAHNVAFWLEKECSLMKLRLIVINGMRTLSRLTSIVHNPRHFEDEVKNLIGESHHQSQIGQDSFTVTPCPVVERHSEQTKSVRYKSTTYSWPHILRTNANNSSKSTERQDI